MLDNLGVFIRAVAGHWVFWIGLFLMIEPDLERVCPTAPIRTTSLSPITMWWSWRLAVKSVSMAFNLC